VELARGSIADNSLRIKSMWDMPHNADHDWRNKHTAINVFRFTLGQRIVTREVLCGLTHIRY